MVPGFLWGKVVEGSGKSWVVVGRQEKRGEWSYRNGGKVGMNSVFLNVGEDREEQPLIVIQLIARPVHVVNNFA
nr:hypothetical protein [Tanacetum cinerariifolium]